MEFSPCLLAFLSLWKGAVWGGGQISAVQHWQEMFAEKFRREAGDARK